MANRKVISNKNFRSLPMVVVWRGLLLYLLMDKWDAPAAVQATVYTLLAVVLVVFIIDFLTADTVDILHGLKEKGEPL